MNYLEINARGLVGGLRGKSDGCVIIGTRGRNTKEFLNDFDVGIEDAEEGKRHMIIKYNMSDRQYYLRDLGEGSGTFVKIDHPLLLKNGYIVSFGDSHLTVNFYQDVSKKTSLTDRIQLKFIDGPNTDKVYEFEKTEIVTIGRMPSCSIRFDDS
jgi:pSer/pThr/pTyr-binding forkhead associated (FHA) protein